MSKTIRRKSVKTPDWILDDYDEDGDYCYEIPSWSSRTGPSKWDEYRYRQRPTKRSAETWFHSDRSNGSRCYDMPSWAKRQMNNDARSRIKDMIIKCKDWDDLCLPSWHKASNIWNYG